MTLYDLPAPAKLNLFLHVVGRRPDGYHLLESLFRLVSLSDSISVDLRLDGVISREWHGETVTDVTVDLQSDLVVRAAKLLQQHTQCRLGAHVSVTKRIPMGAGLGGGSSDAATTLLALNQLWRTGLGRDQLVSLGLKLGADVPFFLVGQSSFVQGIGEIMQPVDLPPASYLIFKPQIGVPTAQIFASPDLTRNTESVKISDFSGRTFFVSSDTEQNGEQFGDSRALTAFGKNDLERVVVQLYPEVSTAIQWVVNQGLAVRMSGSGSCFFAEFDSPEAAELARKSLVSKISNDVSTDISTDSLEVGGSAESAIELISACDGLYEHPLRHWVKD